MKLYSNIYKYLLHIN